MKPIAFHFGWVGVVALCAALSAAQEVTLTARVALVNGEKTAEQHEAANVVVWLTPADGTAQAMALHQGQHPRLVQRNKTFEPHLLVVPVGSVVAFPNHDPFFHNVFSLFEGKRFDLGLYEAGSTRDVHFDKPGISYIFCNIHAEMSAVVVALVGRFRAVRACQAAWRRCWWSLSRLWVAAMSRHSDLTADLPRRENLRKPRLLLI